MFNLYLIRNSLNFIPVSKQQNMTVRTAFWRSTHSPQSWTLDTMVMNFGVPQKGENSLKSFATIIAFQELFYSAAFPGYLKLQ